MTNRGVVVSGYVGMKAMVSCGLRQSIRATRALSSLITSQSGSLVIRETSCRDIPHARAISASEAPSAAARRNMAR